jgi:hypothetical protein
MNFRAVVAAVCVSACSVAAEVLSVTIGVDVNSPYGIGEPWVMIREGLLRLEGVESVSPQPDRQTRTGELRTKGGRVPDVEALAKGLREMGAGASLRGVEATVDGRVEKRGEQFVLRVSKTDETLLLEPATNRIQLQVRKKAPEPLTEAEQKAFQNLSAKWQGQPLDVRITGPINKRDGKTFLAVRQFDFQAEPQKETTK